MTATTALTNDDVVEALDLPARSRVNERIAKDFLIAHGAPTADDRKFIRDDIQEIRWLAAL